MCHKTGISSHSKGSTTFSAHSKRKTTFSMKKQTDTHAPNSLQWISNVRNVRNSTGGKLTRHESYISVTSAQDLTNGFSRLALFCNPLLRDSSQLIHKDRDELITIDGWCTLGYGVTTFQNEALWKILVEMMLQTQQPTHYLRFVSYS